MTRRSYQSGIQGHHKAWLAMLLAIVLGGPVAAQALTGSGESPAFALNTVWATGADDGAIVPRATRLGDSYPNPFNPLTAIRYEIAHPTSVSLRVYDLQGHLVRVLVAAEAQAGGRYEALWDGRDSRGGTVAAGVYLYRLVTDDYVGSRRTTLVK